MSGCAVIGGFALVTFAVPCAVLDSYHVVSLGDLQDVERRLDVPPGGRSHHDAP